MINWDQIKQLEEDVGAEDLGEVVSLFLSEVDQAVDDLKSVPKESEEQVAAMLHFLKGSAFNLGFQVFGDVCSKGEIAAQNGDTADVSFEEIAKLYSESKRVFLADASQHCSLDLG